MKAIEIRGVSKEFVSHHGPTTLRERFVRAGRTERKSLWAVRDVDVALEQGTSLALIGDNGSGKSTLLKLIAGIHRPTSGEILTQGRMSALLELGAGFHPDLTGRDNVFLNGTILGMGRSVIKSRLDDIVEFAGTEAFIDTPIKFYSSGMLLRLAFAVAVHVDPEIMLIDEILAVGDLEFQRKCMEHLHRVRQNGTTVILVSHNLATLREMCDHGLWLDRGRPQLTGSVNDVADAYVEDVNRRAANRQPATDTDEQVHRAVLGSGEVRLTEVEFLSGGATVQAAFTGQPLTIRFHYEAARTIEAADFTLVVHHESGAVVSEPRSGEKAEALRFPAGRGHVDFHMDSLLLAPGIYDLSTAISHQGHAFDWRDRQFVLAVYATGISPGGMVQLPGHWSVQPPSAEQSTP